MKWELPPDKYMSLVELKKLRKVTEDKALADMAKGRTTWPRIWMLIDLACQTGLRVSEIANSKCSDLNLGKEPFVLVRNGKGGKQRTVYISKSLSQHIKRFIKAQGLTLSDYLLTSSHQKAFSTRGLQKHFKTACALAGLPKHYSIHCARHSYATFLYSDKRDLRLIQKQLGHSSVTTTSIYADCKRGDILDSVNKVFSI